MPSLLQMLCPACICERQKITISRNKEPNKNYEKQRKKKKKRQKRAQNTTPMLIVANAHLDEQKLHGWRRRTTACSRGFSSFNFHRRRCCLGWTRKTKRFEIWRVWGRNKGAEMLLRADSISIAKSDGKIKLGIWRSMQIQNHFFSGDCLPKSSLSGIKMDFETRATRSQSLTRLVCFHIFLFFKKKVKKFVKVKNKSNYL